MNNSSILTNATFTEEQDDDEPFYGCPLLQKESTFEKLCKITAVAVIMILSFVGNVLIIVITRRTKHMRTLAYNFVVNMAIGDLCTTIINMPETLAIAIRSSDEWLPGIPGVVICKLLPFSQQVCAFCSILSLMAIALDRYFAICLPLRRIRVLTGKRCKIVIGSTWLISCVSSAPMLVANNVMEFEGWTLCLEEWPSPLNSMSASRAYTIALFVIFYLLPLVMISILYGTIIYTLWKRKSPGNCSANSARIFTRGKRKALKMFIAIVTCFALCWLPYHVIFFITGYSNKFYECGLPENIEFISFVLLHAISAFNPCLYMTFNKYYRDGAKRLITACCNF